MCQRDERACLFGCPTQVEEYLFAVFRQGGFTQCERGRFVRETVDGFRSLAYDLAVVGYQLPVEGIFVQVAEVVPVFDGKGQIAFVLDRPRI